MKQIALITLMILPFFLIIIWYFRNDKTKWHINESLLFSLVNKDAFIEGLKNLCAEKKWDLHFDNNEITINTNISLLSFGEIITINFLKEDDAFYVKVSSKPKVKTTIIDYNKNKSNIAIIKGLLEKKS